MQKRLVPFISEYLFLHRSFNILKIFAIILSLSLAAGSANAQNYLTNGMGEYSEFNETTLILKLELESPATDPLEAIAVDTNKKLSIRILKDKSPRAWSRIWIQNLSINNPPDTIKAQTNDLIAMTQAIKGTLVAGDLVEFERVANDLTIMSIDDVEITDFTTPEFFEFLLSAFIGSIPPSSELKAALLSGGDVSNETSVFFDSMGYLNDRPARLARWAKPAPAPVPAAEPEPEPAPAVEEEPVEVAEAAPEEVVEEVVEETVEEVAEEVAEAEPVVEETVEEVVEEEDAPILITAESLLAAQNYQRAVLAKVYQNIKYPSSAQRRNREGSLRVAISIGEDGRLINAEVVQNARYSTFDDAALRAVKSAAPFDPLPVGTLEIPMVLEVPIAFKLQ